MTESELRERLRATPVPADPAAEERAWRVVQGAYAPACRPRERSRRRWLLPVPASLSLVSRSSSRRPAPRATRWPAGSETQSG